MFGNPLDLKGAVMATQVLSEDQQEALGEHVRMFCCARFAGAPEDDEIRVSEQRLVSMGIDLLAIRSACELEWTSWDAEQRKPEGWSQQIVAQAVVVTRRHGDEASISELKKVLRGIAGEDEGGPYGKVASSAAKALEVGS